MSALDCCGLARYCGQRLGLIDEKIDMNEASQRIEKEAQKWRSGDNRSAFWGDFTKRPSQISPQLYKSLLKFEYERNSPGLAVDLGCGNSSSTLLLLQKGWKVIAVDNAEQALENLKQQVDQFGSNWIEEGQLSLVRQNMETYEFPKDVQIILANDSLPYCDPLKIKELWDKAYASLAKGGRIIGSFFPDPNDPTVERLHRALMGAWFTDKAVVHALLDDKGYQTEVCGYNKYWFEPDPRYIEFVGRKV